jgi:hypothetical protein
MIPIQQAIDTGAWLTAGFEPRGADQNEINDERTISFQLRVTNFTRIDLAAIDEPEKLSCSASSSVWKLDFDVINTCRRELSVMHIVNRVCLSRKNRFTYRPFRDGHLSLCSTYEKEFGLRSTFSLGSFLPPNIKRSGALPFLLSQPNAQGAGLLQFEESDDIDDLFINIYQGTIREPTIDRREN